LGEGFTLAPEHAGDGIGQFATTAAFDELTIEEMFIYLPASDRCGPEVGGTRNRSER
jgi:hypothetical protein